MSGKSTPKTEPTVSLFDQLAAMGSKPHKIGVALIDYDKVKYDEKTGEGLNLKELSKDAEVAYFDVTPVTPLIEEGAAQITNKATPPPLFEDHPARPTGVIKKLVGYNDQDPEYIKTMEKLTREREIFICLSCCEKLRESTPGDDMPAMIESAKKSIPRTVISGLFNGIANIGGLQQDASFFLNKESTASKSSKTTET